MGQNLDLVEAEVPSIALQNTYMVDEEMEFLGTAYLGWANTAVAPSVCPTEN